MTLNIVCMYVLCSLKFLYVRVCAHVHTRAQVIEPMWWSEDNLGVSLGLLHVCPGMGCRASDLGFSAC